MFRLNTATAAPLLRFALLLITVISLAACGSSHQPLPGDSSAEEQRIVSERVVLTVLPDTYIAGGQAAAIEVTERQGKGEVLVDVTVKGARALKALFFHMEFDARRYSVGRLDSRWLLAPENECLSLLLSTDGGILEYGELIILPQEARADGSEKGFSGDGLLCTLHLKQTPTVQRTSSLAPASPGARAEISLDPLTRTLSWGYRSPGDYNQNGTVAITDLTPIGIHFQKRVPVGQPESIEAVVDGGGDGIVNISDLTPIGLNFLRRTEGYKVYASALASDKPEDNQPSTIPEAALLQLTSASGDAGQERVTFSHQFPALPDGIFLWVRPFDGSNEGSVSNAVQFVPENLPPVADLSADVLSGEAPLTVNFDASGSSDPDGTITDYSFDFDGSLAALDWVSNGADTSVEHVFENPGTVQVFVRTTDNHGGTDSEQIFIEVLEPDISVPVAHLEATPNIGQPPLLVTLDAAGSSTTHPPFTLYEWDLDGNGTFEESGPNPTTQNLYTELGSYNVGVRVTDINGKTGVSSALVVISAVGDPVAVITAIPSQGFAPHTVTLDANLSTDSDGVLTKFEWDYEGDGIYDLETTTVFTVEHTYTVAGNYKPRLRVTDDDNRTGVDETELTVFEPAPQAVLYAAPRYGVAPLQVSFDASESFSPGQTITVVEWDFDGDGNIDLNSGVDLEVQHLFSTPGVFDSEVYITDSVNKVARRIMLVMVTPDNSFPPADCVFALPSQSKASPGQSIGVEVYTSQTANTFYFPYTCVTWEAGSHYEPNSFNVGSFGGTSLAIDGIWTAVNPASGFLEISDSLLQERDAGGGRVGVDMVAVPLGGTEVPGASGAIYNFNLLVNSDITLGFLRTGDVELTYYNAISGPINYWTHDDNAGMPGIDML